MAACVFVAVFAFALGAALVHALHRRRAATGEVELPCRPAVAEHAELTALAAASMFKVSRGLQTELARAREEVGVEKQKSHTLSAEARTDKLTGLPNRRVFDEELERSLDLWQSTRQAAVSLMLIDVDHFKQINDRHGHATGDAALKWLARTARSQVAEAGLAVRYGGEEFAVIVTGVKIAEAIELADKLRLAIAAEPFEHDGLTLSITASIGVATSLADDGPKLLAHRADEALYAAKENGRNRVYLHNGCECLPVQMVAKPRGSGYNYNDRVLVAR